MELIKSNFNTKKQRRPGVAWVAFIRRFVTFLQFMSGVAAFSLSASTSAFVLHHIFPYPYIPLLAGISLDLAKVSSIFMHRFQIESDPQRLFLARVWRGILVCVAALFTCIAVSGMLLNKNEANLLIESQNETRSQFEVLIQQEQSRYKDVYDKLEAGKAEERKTGIGKRYLKLEDEQKVLTASHDERLITLKNELNNALQSLSQAQYESDRRKNDVLFENFRETINRSLSLNTTYEWWILLIVVAVAAVLEMTIYVVFDNLAWGLAHYVHILTAMDRQKWDYELAQLKNDLNYQKRKEDIVLDGKVQILEDAKEANVMNEKFETTTLKVIKELGEEISEIRDELKMDEQKRKVI